jgi:methyl-accepting chemotaxis protein
VSEDDTLKPDSAADESEPPKPPEGNGGLLQDLGARGLAGALRPLGALGAMTDDIKEMTAHVTRMAGNTDTLPEVTKTLRAIRERVDHMDQEVTEMHAAVEELTVLLEPIAGQLESVTRITNRLPGGRRHRRAQAEAQGATEPDDAERAHDAE